MTFPIPSPGRLPPPSHPRNSLLLKPPCPGQPEGPIPDGLGVQLKGNTDSVENLDKIKDLGLTWSAPRFHLGSH